MDKKANTGMQKKSEIHLVGRANWLRAAVLGANDGVLSTASIVSGVAAGGAPHQIVFLTGLASLVAGATSMATGEYVSVSSQADIENADLARERLELKSNHAAEEEELAHIYVKRGVEISVARTVAKQMMAHDALGAHARDELGINEISAPKPLQAALSSAASFAGGSLLPLLAITLSPEKFILWIIPVVSLAALVLLGVVSAKTGGTRLLHPIMRIALWGAVSMGITALVSHFFGVQP
jgi:VIT1/CCC1 family predicted Fe2+/Mn2+ transporter